MPINKFLYFGDFLAIPVAVAVLTYSALAAGGLWAAADFGVSLLIGLATWTLVDMPSSLRLPSRAGVLGAPQFSSPGA